MGTFRSPADIDIYKDKTCLSKPNLTDYRLNLHIKSKKGPLKIKCRLLGPVDTNIKGGNVLTSVKVWMPSLTSGSKYQMLRGSTPHS